MEPHLILEILGGPFDGDLVGCPLGTTTLDIPLRGSHTRARHEVQPDACYARYTGCHDATPEPTP